MKVFIGIDPSINSTGITVLLENNDPLFYIITGNKLTKRDILAENEISKFGFLQYTKNDTTVEDSHLAEQLKTWNFIEIITHVTNIISKYKNDEVTVVMEGISYGSSIRTRSVFDLAGLNYMIRYSIMTNLPWAKLFVCPPSEIKKFATGKGNANKEIITNYFLMRFPEMSKLKKVDDIADSYYMANYGTIIKF